MLIGVKINQCLKPSTKAIVIFRLIEMDWLFWTLNLLTVFYDIPYIAHIFQVCIKICAFSRKKDTKRQKCYTEKKNPGILKPWLLILWPWGNQFFSFVNMQVTKISLHRKQGNIVHQTWKRRKSWTQKGPARKGIEWFVSSQEGTHSASPITMEVWKMSGYVFYFDNYCTIRIG